MRTSNKPDTKELMRYTDAFSDPSVFRRVQALQECIGWYSNNLPYLLSQHPLSHDETKDYERLKKFAVMATSDSEINQVQSAHEKITAGLRALDIYEKIWGSFVGNPNVAKVYRGIADDTRTRTLALREEPLGLLNRVFEPLQVQFSLADALKARTVEMKPDSATIVINHDIARTYVDAINAGRFADVLAQEATMVAVVRGVKAGLPNVAVRDVVAPIMQAIASAQATLNGSYPMGKAQRKPRAASGPSATQQATGPVAAPVTPNVPPATPPPAPQGSPVSVFPPRAAKYSPNSDNGKVFATLFANQGVWMPFKTLIANCNGKTPKDAIYFVRAHGKESKQWRVDVHKGQAVLTII